MTASSTGTPATGFSCGRLIRQTITKLDAVPYWLLALPLRAAVAPIFWRSGMTKIADWDATLYLFSEEYQVPLLPPELAAYLATTVELVTPPLLILGLLTRPVAAVLLGMTIVIQLAVYPNAWPVHIQWAAMLLILLCRGAGSLSLDHLLSRRMGATRS
ncbi:DoxX family protein [Azospirillum griseum]|uniref:DoxX family protein n=1 Tax=Azospirillum griseum TaxID=2496639 RepID=A0A431VA65_9PROT|nr:DoxX family protein [Azospirillum griseum]RTR13105.1 DoxX family protein [Azospirillum griseum]